MDTLIIIIGIGFIIIALISIILIINKYVFKPIFFNPIIFKKEVLEFLNQKNLELVIIRNLTKIEKKTNPFTTIEKDVFEKIFYSESYKIIIGYSKVEHKFKMYWFKAKLNRTILGFDRTTIEYILEKDIDKNSKIQLDYSKNNVRESQ